MSKIAAKECQNVEYKRSWKDEYLKWICGFANAQGATMFFGVDDDLELHGLQNAKRLLEGIPLNKVINQFKADLDAAACIVCHNVEFDKKIVGAEMIRLGMRDEVGMKKSLCTMLASTNFCRIRGYYGYKYPKLQELYWKLFGEDFDDAHNAMNDIEATERCFWELKKRGIM